MIHARPLTTSKGTIRRLICYVLLIALVAGSSACSRFQKEKRNEIAEQLPVTALYQEAKTALNKRSWKEAVELYQTLLTRFPYGQFSEQSQLELAYAYFKSNRTPLAIATLQRFLEAHPTHPNADYAYYLTGLIVFDEDASWLGRLNGRADLSDRDPQSARKSIDAFETLLNRFPDSKYAIDARRRVLYIGTALARHELHVAEYYLRREAYVAVVNRARGVVENYGHTPVIEDALGIMATAYKELGMDDLSTDTVRILALNFPDSPHLDRVAKNNPARLYTGVATSNSKTREEQKETKSSWFSRFRGKPAQSTAAAGS